MKLKISISFLTIILMFFGFLLPVFAHSGDTDWRGGHYDSSTGEYHYHHGYPAHQHTDGKCPYDYSNKTSYNSSTSSSSKNSPNEDSFGFGGFIVAVLFVVIIIVIVFFAKNLLER